MVENLSHGVVGAMEYQPIWNRLGGRSTEAVAVARRACDNAQRRAANSSGVRTRCWGPGERMSPPDPRSPFSI